MGKIIEGFWDCKYCNTTSIKGGLRECPNCGKARDENTIFYLNPKKMNYVSEPKAVHISRNPDWICQYCNQLNSDNVQECISCGAPRTLENLNYFENRSEKNKKEQEEKLLENSSYDLSESLSDVSNNSHISSSFPKEKNYFSLKNFFSIHKFPILITLFSLIGLAALIFLFIPKPQEITIQELSWQRSIDIEKYQTVEENGWYLPTNARLLYSQEEFSHYIEILDHYETKTKQVSKERIVGYEDYVSGYRDLGNGYFEEITSSKPIYETYYETETYDEPVYRDEAVYRTKYYYEIDKWLYERSVKTNGDDKNPYWGKVTLSSNEQISSKRDSYSIIGLNKKGKEESITLSFADWNSLEIGETVTLNVSFGYGEIVE